MALMVARFLRFYPGYTDESVMRMSARRFFVLNRQILRLQAEEEATSLAVTHNGKPAERMRELIERIKGIEKVAPAAALVVKGEATYESQPGEIAALRERQKAAAEAMKRNKEQWLAEQQAKQQAGP